MNDAEIIVVSNGSTDGTKTYLEGLGVRGVRYLWFDDPLGFSKAVNKGIEASLGQYIVILNNDTELLIPSAKDNAWLNLLTVDEDTITGPLMRKLGGKDFLIFFCAMVPRKVIDKIGMLDEVFGMGGQEDVDYCIRAIKAGFRIQQIPADVSYEGKYANGPFPIWHKGEQTVHEEKVRDRYERVFRYNTQLVVQKHFDYFEIQGVPKIAIVMPIYNSGTTLAKSLEGIINQSYSNWVLFTIDDCSSDNSFSILDSYGRNNPRILFSKLTNNIGPSEARNLALKEIERSSDFDYIAFCDSDDVWVNRDHLKENLIFLQATQGDIVYSDVNCFFENGDPCHLYGVQFYDFPTYEKIREGNWIYISTVLMKQKLGYFDKEFDGIEDWHYWLRALKEGRAVYHLNHVHVHYLVKQNGAAGWAGNKEKIKRLSTEAWTAPKFLPPVEVPIDAPTAEKPKYLEPVIIPPTPPEKIVSPNLIRLNLGCGDQKLEGYINCDLHNKDADMVIDVSKLPYEDNTIDEICAIHLMEHFYFLQAFDVLNEWFRVLKPGGKLIIETPDFVNSCRRFVESDKKTRISLYSHFFAWPWLPGQTNYFLYTEDQLRHTLETTGFSDIVRLEADSSHAKLISELHGSNWKNIYLKVQATKK